MNKVVIALALILTTASICLLINKTLTSYSLASLATKPVLKNTQISMLTKAKNITASPPSMDDWEQHIDELPPNEKKIAQAILSFREKLQHITKEDLEAEQRDLKETLANARALKLPEPVQEEHIDNNGNLWLKKTYDEGIVRYDFPEAVQ